MNKKKIDTIINNLEIADKIGKKLLKMSDINFFENTRKREYVELRSLLVYILYNKMKMPWVRISEYFKNNGKNMDHANVIYLEKTYLDYRNRNPRLLELEKLFDTPENLPEAYINLKDKYEKLEFHYNFVNDFFEGVPSERFNEVMENITQLKKSWKWKYPLKK
jgi:hypothetical protein